MRRFFAIAAAMGLLLSSWLVDAAEDPPLAQAEILWMLRLDDVREDLKLDPQQMQGLDAVIETMHIADPHLDTLSPEDKRKKIDELLDKADLTMSVDEALARVFTPEQQARYAQLKLHFRGIGVLQLDSVATALALTDNQRRKISEKIAALGPGGVASIRNSETQIERVNDIWDVLTVEQEDQWDKMAGRRFDFESVRARTRRVPLARTTHVTLLRNEDVLKELRVGEEARARIAILLEKMAMELNFLSSAEFAQRNAELPRMVRQLDEVTRAGLARFLTAEQLARFDQLDLQHRGIWEIAEKPTADRLGLTEAQRQKIGELKALSSRRVPGTRPTSEELNARRDRAKIQGEAYEVLTPEQKQMWEQLQGAKFDFSPRQSTAPSGSD